MSDGAENSMIFLLIEDLKSFVAELEEGVVKIKKGSFEEKDREALTKSVATVKGSSKLLKIDALFHLAKELEALFQDQVKQKEAFKEAILSYLERVLQLLQSLLKLEPAQIGERDKEIEALSREAMELRASCSSGKEEKGITDLEVKEEKTFQVDPVMIALFREELASQLELLSASLLKLEEGEEQEQEALEELMRAAHSIKGAARVVGLDPIVHLAHSMEDCFVAAQKENLSIKEEAVDTFLQAVDLISSIQNVENDQVAHWIDQKSEAFKLLIEASQSILSGEPIIPQLNEDSSPKEETVRIVEAASQEIPKKSRERVLKVTAESLNRLMGFAGESLVESRWLSPFEDSLILLKKEQNEIVNSIDAFYEFFQGLDVESEALSYFQDIREKVNLSRQNISDRIVDLESFIQRHASLSDRLYQEVIKSRMRPFLDGIAPFPRTVRDMSRKLEKKCKLQIFGKKTQVDRDILEKLEAPMNHLIRNALDHGLEHPDERKRVGKKEEGTLKIEAGHRAGMLMITISDDGKGIDVEILRKKIVEKELASKEMVEKMNQSELLDFLFLPGFSTAQKVSEYSGRGVGLDVVYSMIQDVGGKLSLDTDLGKGTTFCLQLPLTLSVIRALIVSIGGEPYAFPLTRVDHVLNIHQKEIQLLEDRQFFQFQGQNIALIPAYKILDLEDIRKDSAFYSVIVMTDKMNTYGLVVDQFLGEKELVVQELDNRLGKVPDISAGAIMENGDPCLIIDIEDVITSIDQHIKRNKMPHIDVQKDSKRKRAKRILVVDDSITVREVEVRILEKEGFIVETAADGMEGWNAVRIGEYDLVVSDIDMPRMNGIELTTRIKKDMNLSQTPVVIVSYKDREEDRSLGREAGVDAYLTKSSFQDDSFLHTIYRLLNLKQKKN